MHTLYKGTSHKMTQYTFREHYSIGHLYEDSTRETVRVTGRWIGALCMCSIRSLTRMDKKAPKGTIQIQNAKEVELLPEHLIKVNLRNPFSESELEGYIEGFLNAHCDD